MRVGWLTVGASVLVVASLPAAAQGHGSASTHAEHRVEDAAPHNVAAEPQLMKHTRAATALDAQAAAAAVAGNEHEVGSWGPLVNWPVVGVHVALLPNGKVVAYDSVGDAATERFTDHTFTRATVWDPETGTHTDARVNTGFNVFCSGLAHLPDGSLFLAGGNRNAQLQGIAKTHVFDHTNNGWSLGADMAFSRWYPTVTPLRNGEMLITEGGPDIPEVRSTTGALRSLSAASLNLPLYPWIDVAPDGRAFYSGPNQTMRALNTAGAGAWQSFGQRDALNRDYGSHALYDVGRILVAGGGASSADARVININNINVAAPQVSATAPMANGRRQHNLTVLADGTVLATGGNSSGEPLIDMDSGVYAAELWNPAGTGTWSTLAAEQATRQYHSTALLLPDGRVLSSGGGICGTCDDVEYLAKNAQVFTPPYLFKADGSGELAPRPAIASAPGGVAYGAGFQIGTPAAAAVRKVALVRLGAVTHSVNMEQRYVPLNFTAGPGTLTATAPANANIAPPGVYMLFIVDDNGVPSVAKMVTVSDSAPPPADTTPPSAPAGLTATAAGSSQVNLSWTPATDNVGVTGYRVERCQGAGCTIFTEVATPTGTTYNDTERSASTTYRYRVRAADAANNLGGYSPEAQASTSSAPAMPPGLVGAWAFSEGSGSTTADASGNGNLGTITNATWSTQGRYGNALSFNGTSSVVRVPSAASLNLTTGMTLSAWIRPTASQSGWRTIVQRQADAYFLTSSNDQPMRPAGGGTIGGGVRYVGGPTANPLNTWTHVALTFDGNQLRLHVNGTQVATRGANGTIQTVANPLWIGGNQPYGEYFQGLIDEVRVYNRALTATDIQTDMNTSIVPTAPDTTAPSTPSGLTATAASANQVNLSWTASNDNVGVTGYRVERCTGATCTVFTEVGTPTTTTFNDTGRTPATAYRYRVRAVDAAGNFSAYSTIASATTPAAPDTTAPTAPAGLTATAVSPTQVDLAWTASNDNVGVTGYRVERCTGATCTVFTEVGTPTTTTFNDTGRTPATAYRYRVRAVDAAGNFSAYSTIASATTPAAPDTTAPTAPAGLTATAVSPTQIDLAWTASTDNVGVTGYRVERCTGATCTVFTQVGTPTTTTFNDTGRTPATAYRYRVRAVDAAGNFSAYSTIAPATTPPLPDTTPPTAPTGLTASPVGSGRVDLGWTASTDSGGVAGYRVERCQGPGCSTFAQVATPTATTHSDTSLSPSTTYRYQVRAVDTSNNFSGYSGVAEATTGPALDTSPPGASVTAPPAGSVVSGSVTVSATATDNVGVAGVQFLLDGSSLGAEDTTAPYSMTWDTTTVPNGVHTLQARARDTAGNLGTSSSSVTVTVSNSAPPPTPGLVGGWSFNENIGTTVNDVSGNANTATAQGNPAWTLGRYGGGLRFNGAGDYLTAPNSPTLNISGSAMTLSMWVNPLGSGGGDQVVFAKFWSGAMSSSVYQYALELHGGRTPHFYIGTADGLRGVSMGTPLALSQWSHLAIVFNGSQAQFYVNGNLVSSPPMSETISARASFVHVAADVNPGQFFNGTLDDVRLYSRAETALEVMADMNRPLSAGPADTTAPAVSVTSPAEGAVVSGARTLQADASDDVGVAGVQFFVDGNPQGPEDTVAPYAANWDTRATPNGAHVLAARARDTDNKTTVSTPVNVTVANTDTFQNEVLSTGFDLPTAMKFLPDGRLLLTELGGKILVLPPPYTTPNPTPFLQITNIPSSGVQAGIFDLALDPNFAANHYFYVFYTTATPGSDRLSRFTANSALTGTVAGSELVLYQDPQGADIEHHGGAITFGNDGMIYFTTGDHFQGTPSQNLNSPRGKIHRIWPDGLVPTDNPFYDGSGPHWDSVWAYGLRNPFRAYYDRPTGRLFVGDVGGNGSQSWEEVDLGARGANYGWPDVEGPCSAPCTNPLYSYIHNGNGSSITGGFVYHGTQFPSGMQGNYFFADYSGRWIKRMAFDSNGNFNGVFNFEPLTGNNSAGDIVYLIEGPDGALYYLDLGYADTTGTFGISKLRRIRYLASNQAPVALASADKTSGPAPLAVNFSSAGSNDPEGQAITYSWDFGDGSLSTAANPSHTFASPGQYVVRLTVSDGENSSISTPVTISVGSPPTATITAPTDGASFRAGDVISYSGDATDPDDGNLPASAYAWNIDFLHDTHVHPGTAISGVKSGTFVIPTAGHDFEGNTRYRITLTVTDANGLRDTKSVIVWPQKVNLPFAASPSGLTVYVDGVARTTPFVLDTLVGFNHTIDARDQTSGGNNYSFTSWSDGGAQSHTITAPSTAQSYTASYSIASAPSGVMAAWGFNEASGTTTADVSGNNNTATLLGGPTRVAGKYGNALSFDQVNDYLSVPNSPSLNFSGSAATLSMWINPGSLSGDSVVLGKFWNTTMSSPSYQYGLELSGGRPHFYIGTSAGLVGASMDTALALNQWTHLAVVFNGLTAQFYVNGTMVSTKSLVATITARGMALRMGADASTWQFYKGLLDNVRIYNRILTPAEVQTDMNSGL